MNSFLTQSNIKPEKVKIDEYHVYICRNITEKEVNDLITMDGENLLGISHTIYEYDMDIYCKDEYITLMSEQNDLYSSALDDLVTVLAEGGVI